MLWELIIVKGMGPPAKQLSPEVTILISIKLRTNCDPPSSNENSRTSPYATKPACACVKLRKNSTR